jgi:hypothetical protein
VNELTTISDELHERVQRFAGDPTSDSFAALALDIARFQAQASDGFRRLVRARGARLSSLDEIPPVPCDAFRLTRVACFGPELDRVRFFTSGTTAAERGTHTMRRTDTYERLSLLGGQSALLGASGSATVVALAAPNTTPPNSSLGYMMARFIEAFDREPLDAEEGACSASWPGRWLLGATGVNLVGLEHAARVASRARRPVLLLATAFALVRLLDELAGAKLPLPIGSVVMQTGGFKGRTREVPFEELRDGVTQALQLGPGRVVGEYGMTELTSQLYEGTLRESALFARHPHAEPGLYFEPAWLRVTPVDPVTLLPVPEGEVGLARFMDLGNVDSAVCVVSQDLVRRNGGGIQLLGRQPGAPPRGCSLAVEELLRG